MPAHSKRTPEVVAEVLARLATGELLSAICRSDPKFPTPTGWLQWCAADDALKVAYVHAREEGHDVIAESLFDIADDCGGDAKIITTDDGKIKAVFDGEAVQRAKLRIYTRMQLLAKWSPKKYGEKTTLDVGNKEGETLKIDTGADAQTLAVALASQFRLKKRDPDPDPEAAGEDLI